MKRLIQHLQRASLFYPNFCFNYDLFFTRKYLNTNSPAVRKTPRVLRFPICQAYMVVL